MLGINQGPACWLVSSGEALGAIGNPEVLDLLKQYVTDPVVEVRTLGLLQSCRDQL